MAEVIRKYRAIRTHWALTLQRRPGGINRGREDRLRLR
jgi:hypothetical protein